MNIVTVYSPCKICFVQHKRRYFGNILVFSMSVVSKMFSYLPRFFKIIA